MCTSNMLLVVSEISGQQEKRGLKVFQRKRSWHKREREGEYRDSKFGPLIVGVLLIHRDTINSPKSSQWVRRGEDSEAGRSREERYWSKNPRMSQETYIMLTRALLFALQQGHCSTHTGVMHQTQTGKRTSLTCSHLPPRWLIGRGRPCVLSSFPLQVCSATSQQMSSSRTHVALCHLCLCEPKRLTTWSILGFFCPILSIIQQCPM